MHLWPKQSPSYAPLLKSRPENLKGARGCGSFSTATLVGGRAPKTARPYECINSAQQRTVVQWMSHLPCLAIYIPFHGKRQVKMEGETKASLSGFPRQSRFDFMVSCKEGRGGKMISFIGLESRSSFALKFYLQVCLEAKNVHI